MLCRRVYAVGSVCHGEMYGVVSTMLFMDLYGVEMVIWGQHSMEKCACVCVCVEVLLFCELVGVCVCVFVTLVFVVISKLGSRSPGCQY